MIRLSTHLDHSPFSPPPTGFRFNITSSEMGTRRPLIVQMVHDPSALEPRCRLQEEDSDEYGAVGGGWWWVVGGGVAVPA